MNNGMQLALGLLVHACPFYFKDKSMLHILLACSDVIYVIIDVNDVMYQ